MTTDPAAARLYAAFATDDAVDRHLDVTPVPVEYLDVGGGRVVVVGRYRGSVRATGAEIDAAFVHLLRIKDDRVAELVQVTDTARWHTALAR